MVAQPWDDTPFLEATPLEDEEDLWHVAVEPDEVKVLTLEQLDDLFRLDIIDGSTKVWQPGMSEWLPLSVVAGFEDESAPVPPVQRAKPAALPQPVSAQHMSAQPMHAQPTSWQAAGFGSGAPAPLRSAAPVGGSAASLGRGPALNAPAHNAFAVDSLRPVVSSPSYRPQATSGGSRATHWLLGLAAVAGLSLVLYRNDVLKDAAMASGQQSTFASLESALGGPSFGTLRSIEELSGSLGLENVKVPSALLMEQITTKDKESAAPEKAEESGSAGETKDRAEAKKGDAAEGKAASGSDTSTVSLDALPKEEEGLVEAFEQRMSGKAAKPKAAPHPSNRGGSKENTGSPKNLGFKGSSHEYDPLNPTL